MERGSPPPTPQHREFAEQAHERQHFVKEGPRLPELMRDAETRTNRIEVGVGGRFSQETERISEGAALKNLDQFLEASIAHAQKTGSVELAERAQAFRQNLVYIGEREFQEASEGLAKHIDDLVAGKDHDVILYVRHTKRSERYTALQVLRAFDKRTEHAPELRKQVHVTSRQSDVAYLAERTKARSRVLVIDDVVVSGTRVSGSAMEVRAALTSAGFTDEQSDRAVEAAVVAAPDRSDQDKGQLRSDIEGSMDRTRMFSYYRAPIYKVRDAWAVFPGVSVTSSHSSTDYGYEQFLELLEDHNSKTDGPKTPTLPTNIVRPYAQRDSFHGSRRQSSAEDPLAEEWDDVASKYFLPGN